MIGKGKDEYIHRINQIRKIMKEKNLDLCMIFGDEHRREYLRYVSNFWPIFEKAALFVFNDKDPVLGVGPENERYARESSVWEEIRNISGFSCVTVSEDIDFPFARIYSFKEMLNELLDKVLFKRIGIVGMDLLTLPVFKSLRKAARKFEIVDILDSFDNLRIIKSEQEIAWLKKASEIADLAYMGMIQVCKPSVRECEIAAEGEYVARRNGAELIPFCNVMSGERTNTVIGRATEKKVEKGEIISAALAVQYSGYIATVQFPFAAEGTFSDGQKKLVDALVEAENIALEYLKNGVKAGKLVKEVRSYFKAKGLSKYDIYPPLHGIGTAEAERPYPDEQSKYLFRSGMVVNLDISLFGTEAYSNRIEEGFVITDKGYEPLSKLVRRLAADYLKNK